MARGSDLNNGDSQFFICLADATFLTGLYTLWDKVSSGMDYADLLSVGEPPTLPDRMLSLQVAKDIVSSGKLFWAVRVMTNFKGALEMISLMGD